MVAVAVAISLLVLAVITAVALVLDPEWLDDQPDLEEKKESA